MGIFGNLLVGGMPNIKMAPALTTVELKLPTPFGGAGSSDSSSKSESKGDKEASKVKALRGDTEDYNTYKALINQSKQAIQAELFSIVQKHDGDYAAILKDPNYIENVQTPLMAIKSKEIELSGLKSTIEGEKTLFDKNREEQTSKGLMDKYYTIGADTKAGGDIRILLDKSGNIAGYEDLAGNYYDKDRKLLTEKPTTAASYMTYDDYYSLRDKSKFLKVQDGSVVAGDPLQGNYGPTYTEGALNTHIEKLFGEAASIFNQTGGSTGDTPTAINVGGTIKYYLQKYGYTKNNYEQVNAMIKGMWTKISDDEKYEAKQEYWKAKDSGTTKLGFDDWFTNKIVGLAGGYYSHETGESSKQFIEGVTGAGGGLSDKNMNWYSAAVAGLVDGKAKILDLMTTTEKEKFKTNTKSLTTQYLTNYAAATTDDQRTALTEAYKKAVQTELASGSYASLNTALTGDYTTVTINDTPYLINKTIAAAYKKKASETSGFSHVLTATDIEDFKNVGKKGATGKKTWLGTTITADDLTVPVTTLKGLSTSTVNSLVANGTLIPYNSTTAVLTDDKLKKSGTNYEALFATVVDIPDGSSSAIAGAEKNLILGGKTIYFGSNPIDLSGAEDDVIIYSGQMSNLVLNMADSNGDAMNQLNGEIIVNKAGLKFLKEKLLPYVKTTEGSDKETAIDKILEAQMGKTTAKDLAANTNYTTGSDLKRDMQNLSDNGDSETLYIIKNLNIDAVGEQFSFLKTQWDVTFGAALGTGAAATPNDAYKADTPAK